MSSAQIPDWKKLGRLAIFIDAANVIYSFRKLSWKLDYKRLQKYFTSEAKLVGIHFYIAYFENDKGRKSLLEMLERKGFVVHSKLVKNIATNDGSVIHKANCDVELTMDVMQTYQDFDAIVLLSGDSDFLPLTTFLQEQKKSVVVISRRGHVAKEMVKNADIYLHFDQFKSFWPLKSQNPGQSQGS